MFKNEPLLDFTIEKNRIDLTAALNELEKEINSKPLSVLPIISGKKISSANKIQSVDPANPDLVIAEVSLASKEDAERALEVAYTAKESWSNTPFAERAKVLKSAAALMRKDRNKLSALIIREAGKPWGDSDADVCEAIDFCDYYADEMLRLGTPIPTSAVAGEENYYFYRPRGVAAVIAPWNFPLAIACGMVTAALVTGNTVVFKPAEQSSAIAAALVDILYKAGVPNDVLAFLPGWGEDVGRIIINDWRTDLICFTGSKQVGLEILANTSRIQKGQEQLKRVILEMGGKNAIIVDDDADVDEAVKGILISAFGYAGQKCSACSRLIAVGNVYEPLLERLAEATKDLIVGAPKDSATFLGPVIDEDSQKRILETIAAAEKVHKLLVKSPTLSSGFFVPATIFRDVATTSSLWREEIFGPVLACAQVRSIEDAIREGNNSQYALTGGIYSRNPRCIELAKRDLKAGNLYINRKITGALVFRQPFGGFKMSGIGSKAGGPDYLIQFMEPRAVCENAMRRGFSA